MVEEKKEKSALEVLLDVNKKYDWMVVRLNVIEKEIVAFKALPSCVQNLNENFQNVEKKVDNFSTEVKGLFAFQEQVTQNLKSLIDKLSVRGVEFEGALKGMLETIQRLEKSQADLHSSLTCKIEREVASLVPHQKVDQLHTHFSDRCKQLSEGIHFLEAPLGALRRSVENLEGSLYSKQTKLEDFKKEMEALKKDQLLQSQTLERKVDSVEGKMANDLRCQGAKQSEDLKTLKSSLEGSPSSLEGTKRQLEKTLEIVSLDASNAVLKANNMEHLFRVLERKVEQVLQLVKKLENH